MRLLRYPLPHPSLSQMGEGGRAIKNIQLHDAINRFRAGHEIIGTGFVDFKYFLNKTKKLDINHIIEVRPHVNVLKSRDNLIKLLKNKY